MNRIFVKPVNPDAVLYDPTTKRKLRPEGDEFLDDHFWRRRERDGEVTIKPADEPKERAAPTGREPLTPMTTR